LQTISFLKEPGWDGRYNFLNRQKKVLNLQGYCYKSDESMNTRLLPLVVMIFIIVFSSCGNNIKENTAGRIPKHEEKSPGFVLENETLRIRVVDNQERYIHLIDNYMPGMNGLAALIDKKQNKNIYAFTGLNLECTHTWPPAGKLNELWNAPRVAPMQIKLISDSSVMLSQAATDASGLNFEILFRLGDYYVDQEITFWPDQDIDSSSSFWASYMNQVQNTSIFLRTPAHDLQEKEWFEISSAGHYASNGNGVYARPFDPYGKKWTDHLRDNPLIRQQIIESPGSRNATLEAGFKEYNRGSMDHFYYGLVDDYLYLMIFKESSFHFWISASGATTLRSPAWDYGIRSGRQLAEEKRIYHVRLVYKPFVDIEDILSEVDLFLDNN
jgi:hypothetical protein